MTDEMSCATIAAAMKRARERAGLSMADLSRMSGLEASYISGYEAGKHVPSVIKAAMLADALGISIDEYIGRQI